MIPKKIHYCWFGNGEKSEEVCKCIESWKKFCPDYEIIEWNESNFDVLEIDYIKEAYEHKKWAFVSDYARFKILYENGGIYFDTDVELIRDLSPILSLGAYMGCEHAMEEKSILINPGLGMASEPKFNIYKEIINMYAEKHFLNNDGSFNLETVCEYTTNILKNHGFKEENKIQYISGIHIYPTEYFCPMNYKTGEINITSNTYSIHHYTASWQSPLMKIKSKLKKAFGVKRIDYIKNKLRKLTSKS